jgi:hypothetical protein
MVMNFGRRHAPDERDRNYPMRLLLDPLRDRFFPKGLPPGTRHYRTGLTLDQGPTGTCVEHGWRHKMGAAPIMQLVPLPQYALYRLIVAADEWRDNDYEATAPDDQLQSGTSVRAGAKVLQSMGYIANYLWAQSVEDIRAWHLAGFGGTVMGTTWTTDMMAVDSQGFVSVTGRNEGGHCYTSHGWNDRVKHKGRTVRALRCQNSWGREFGENGFFWIEEDDLARLMADQGEACAAVETKVKR